MHATFPRVRALLQAEVKKLGSVNKVSLKTGLTNNTIGKYLDGLSEPKQETLEKLSAYFKKPIAWLRGDSDDATASANVNAGTVDISKLDPTMRAALEVMLSLSPEELEPVCAVLQYVKKALENK